MTAAGVVMMMLSLLLMLCLATSQLHLSRQDDSRKACPGCQSACGDDETCCQMLTGDWGCCLLPNAVCCPDGRTCCPHGHHCNTKELRCDPAVNTTIVNAARSRLIISETDVGLVCPDHSQCPTPGAACCKQYTGRYGCCAYPQNVCCDDGIHCCPVGTVCDQLHLLCVKYPPSSAAQSLKPAQKAAYFAP